jgi:para-nitrobenzyl esterase
MTQVRVEQGTVDGNQNDGVFSFRGIPYAAPPLGERRWAAPEPPAA